MHLSKHPLFLPLLLIAAASNFNPVASAGTAFESTDDLKTAVNSYCAGTFDADTSPYGSIEGWDVSKITDMNYLFGYMGTCNPPIGDWDVSNVINFRSMFSWGSAFNQDISGWDVSSGTNFGQMFRYATAFNQDISSWDVGSGINFENMFRGAMAFNQDISDWNVSSGKYFWSMFYRATAFNQDISDWNVSSGKFFSGMFEDALAFNQDISDWDVSSGVAFVAMFRRATAFNQDISGWNVSSGTNFGSMFRGATAFNQDISDWYVSSGRNFSHMFREATAFNQDISDWDVSSGNNFSHMFRGATAFNQDISDWEIGYVERGTDFGSMFREATAFNQDISDWDVSSGIAFHNMFDGATSFNQPSLYCKWHSNNAFVTGLGVCLGAANCGWGKTTCPLPDCATCGGDPHLKTFFGHSYSYHGQCDMVLLKSREFAAYAGLDIHIRTTRVDNAKVGYSYISGAAVKLGFDVLEVMDDGELILNGNAVSSPTTFAAGYPLRKTFKGNNNKIIVYDLDLTATKGVPEPIQIRVNTKAKMIFVDVYGRFPDGLGLLGPPSDDSRMLARDGVTDLVGEWNSFGEEWQVRSDEPKLFHENRAPQYPQGCVYESSNTRAMTLRRRLMDGSAVTEKDAEGACSGSKGKSKEFCIADVMATGMLDLAEDEFYLIHE